MEKSEKHCGQEKSGNFIFLLKVREKSGNFLNVDCHNNLLLFLSIIMIGSNDYKRINASVHEIDF